MDGIDDKTEKTLPDGFAIHRADGDDTTIDLVVRRYGGDSVRIEIGRRIVLDIWGEYPHATIAFSRTEMAIIPDRVGVHFSTVGEEHGFDGGYLGRYYADFRNLREDITGHATRIRNGLGIGDTVARFTNLRFRVQGKVIYIDLADLLARLDPQADRSGRVGAACAAPIGTGILDPGAVRLYAIGAGAAAALTLISVLGALLGGVSEGRAPAVEHVRMPYFTPSVLPQADRPAPTGPSVACPVPPLPPFPYTGPAIAEPAINEAEVLRIAPSSLDAPCGMPVRSAPETPQRPLPGRVPPVVQEDHQP